VNNNESIASLYKLKHIARCVHVTENPERINIPVFNNGNSKIGIVEISNGGNIDPI